MDRIGAAWTVTNMQINLSTTSKSADGLSPVFAENVGADDTIVFGPGKHDFFTGIGTGTDVLILLDYPFRYDPAQGNLLFDVRVFNGRGSIDTQFFPSMDAQNSSTDEVSIAWADDVTATVATGTNSVGLSTVFQLSSVPSLQLWVESVFGTNRPVLRWPSQPSVFIPQMSSRLGTNAVWQTITNNIGGIPEDPDRWIYLPVTPPGLSGFYRLIWPSGQLLQSAAVPAAPAGTQDSLHLK